MAGKCKEKSEGDVSHMNGLSVEESNLISIFAGESRTEVIEDISSALKYLEDNSHSNEDKKY